MSEEQISAIAVTGKIRGFHLYKKGVKTTIRKAKMQIIYLSAVGLSTPVAYDAFEKCW